ncbi:MAG: ABC transporter transmembrane domain-containing protein, partial [Pseudomonadota bacterium]
MIQPRANGTSRRLFGWLWSRYLRRHTGLVLVAFLLMSIEGSMMGAMSYMLKPMFDTVFIEGQSNAIWWVGTAFFLIFLIRAITGISQKVLMTRVAQKTTEAIQKDLLGHLMTLDTLFHQKNPPGYLMARVQSDVAAVSGLWTAIITGAGRDAVALISLFGVALYIDWIWTLIALIGTPFMIAPTLVAQRQVRKNSRKVLEVTGRMST